MESLQVKIERMSHSSELAEPPQTSIQVQTTVESENDTETPFMIATSANTAQSSQFMLKTGTARHGDRLRGCTSFKDDRPVVERCVRKLTVKGFQRHWGPRSTKKSNSSQPFSSNVSNTPTTTNSFTPTTSTRKEFLSVSSEFVTIIHSTEKSTWKLYDDDDDDHEIEDEPVCTSLAASVEDPQPIESVDENIQIDSASDDEMVETQPMETVEKPISGTTSTENTKTRPKKMWNCAVCNKDYSLVYKTNHLKRVQHQKNISKQVQKLLSQPSSSTPMEKSSETDQLVLSSDDTIQPSPAINVDKSVTISVPPTPVESSKPKKLWHCPTCNMHFSNKHQHLRTNMHRQKEEENRLNNNQSKSA